MGGIGSEVIPGAIVAAALAVYVALKQVTATNGVPSEFWPTTLQSLVTVVIAVAGAAVAAWQWLIRPLQKADKALERADRDQRDEMARIAQAAHNTAAEVEVVEAAVAAVEHSRDTLQRDVGRIEGRLDSLMAEMRQESTMRNQHHAETMKQLGEITGRIAALADRRRRDDD